MTDDEIDALPAGPELDALVAEHVMEQAKPTTSHDEVHIGPIYHLNWYCLPVYAHGDVCEWNPMPFSTDIAAAWEVADNLKMSIVPYPDGRYHAADGRVIAYAETAPLAICRAALKSLPK